MIASNSFRGPIPQAATPTRNCAHRRANAPSQGNREVEWYGFGVSGAVRLFGPKPSPGTPQLDPCGDVYGHYQARLQDLVHGMHVAHVAHVAHVTHRVSEPQLEPTWPHMQVGSMQLAGAFKNRAGAHGGCQYKPEPKDSSTAQYMQGGLGAGNN